MSLDIVVCRAMSYVVCDVVAETTLRAVNNDEMVTDVDESAADRAGAEQRLSCILCMESIDSTDRLQQHLLMVGHLTICSLHCSPFRLAASVLWCWS